MLNNRFWKKRAENYNKTSWVKDDHLLDAYLSLIPKNNIYKNILEVGIGTGVVANKVVDMIGPMIGLDKSKEMMSKIDHEGINKVVGDAHNLPFNDNHFDFIYMRNVIHYLENPTKAFAEILRCLKNGSFFLFSQVIPFSDKISEEYDELIGRDIHYPNHGEINELFSDYTIIKEVEYVLEGQSIMNWLDNTCDDKQKKQLIIDKHKNTSNMYKKMVNYREDNDDISVDIKHLFVLAEKK
ncbi:MAG: class I SAM-dependent methyltransferase [Candidatus Marinimicrobia bacterium]|nr:class I SAM-dependent methyltransferase [Candidatus Neomarinimicrobiota bacterium]MBL7110268.1 class I SAM-dependent methyltransferase [Candidatus Neomarinimicrobiota bacterium]